MSQIKATITQINTVDNLNIVTFDFHGMMLKMMSLDLMSGVEVGKKVMLAVKPTHIAIAKDFTGMLSYSNQIKAVVQSCEMGILLSSVKLLAVDVLLESIITSQSALIMDIKAGDEVTAMIKASEVSIVELLDE
ncbi:MAG TPA: transporter [Epsilonproteobacteria bacterium]|nr:transporter [Campylobacterota bacterium]HHE05706.1 transporter [Campylobacterota bacterium]